MEEIVAYSRYFTGLGLEWLRKPREESQAHFPIACSGSEWDVSRIQIQRLTTTAGVSVYWRVIALSCSSKAHRKQSRLALRTHNIDSFSVGNLLHVPANRLRQK